MTDKLYCAQKEKANGFATGPASWRIALNLLENKLVDGRLLVPNKVEIDIQLVKYKVGYKTLLIPNV